MKKVFLLISLINIVFALEIPLSIEKKVSASVEQNKIKYYKIEGLTGQTIKATIDKLSADGDLYLKVGSKPTLSVFDCKSTNSKKIEDSCMVNLKSNSSVYIGVYGFKSVKYRLEVTLAHYGEIGSSSVAITSFLGDSTSVIIHPTTWNRKPTPVVFFAPGFKSHSYKEYITLLKYIASQGYSVIYVRDRADIDEKDVEERFKKYQTIVNKFSRNLNTKKIGMLGFSSGGGISFSLLSKIIHRNKNWGIDGRFLFVMDPWFSFGMNKSDMRKIVDTNVVILQFGKQGSSSDPRISLVEYKLLSGVAKEKKDYQVYTKERANHLYPMGNRDVSKMQGVLKPLDALMKFTFQNEKSAYKVALKQGSDYPYINGYIKFKSINQYAEGGCKGEDPKQKSLISKYTIDYCDTPSIIK